MTYIYELPTTGSVSFSSFLVDVTEGNAYASRIAEATQARANLRAVLKHSRRTDSEQRDYLRIIKLLDDYIPHLRGIIACIQSGELYIKSEQAVVFSWRTTLSATLFNNSPRLQLPSLHADLASTLLAFAMALSNFSHSVITSLGAYEFERAISEKERKEKDDKLNFGVTLLCKASGVFSKLSENILDDLNQVWGGGTVQPPDLCKEVNAALAKLALADAQSLAIRKLLSKAAFDSILSPGPPLPKSHPSTALLAKLHLDCAALYSSARSLVMTSSKSSIASGLKATFGSISKSQNDSGASGEVSADLLQYLEKEAKFHFAIAHKWLGVDAGEAAKPGKGGEAVGFLRWAQQELEDLHAPRFPKGLGIGRGGTKDGEQDRRRLNRKTRTQDELKSVKGFLEHYQRINNSLTFDPVPKQSELQTLIPEGRMAVTMREYTLPEPAFGPGSKGYQVRARRRKRSQEDDALGVGVLRMDGQADNSNHDTVSDDSSEDESNTEGTSTATRTYVGAGSYF